MSSSSTITPAGNAPTTKRASVRLRFKLLALLAIVAALLFWPQSFRWIVSQAIYFEAKRQGLSVQFQQVDGNITEPLVFSDIRLETVSPQGVQTTVRIDHLTASFSWWKLVPPSNHGWLQDLKVDGLNGDFRVMPDSEQETTSTDHKLVSETPWLSLLAPVNVEARNINLRLLLSGDAIVLNGANFSVSKLRAGDFTAQQLIVDNEVVNREFRNISGGTSWQDQMLSLYNVKLADGVMLSNITTDLRAFLRRQLLIEFAADAFGGDLRGELRDSEEGHLNYEASGSFSGIHLDALARFIGSHDPAGGLIDEGKFTFRGSPRSPEKATVSVRFSSHDFRWGQRRCDSFVLGATLLHRRLLIPDLELKQANNTLNLKGEMALPGGAAAWWKSEFNFDVSAKLDDLNQFSKLLGPKFDGLFGKLDLDGSIRGENQQFSGQLIATGSHLSYRGAPLDSLQAALKLDGNDLQVINFELLHGNDYLRGKGDLNILGNRQYSGELKSSIADLTIYSSLLQPPIAPQPLGGSLNVEWSGDGTDKAHSGAFHAIFNQLRPFGTEAAKDFHPLNADIEGTYSPGNVFLKQCTVSTADTQFKAQVAVSPESVNLEAIQMKHGKQTWLQGNAMLPINVWSAWPYPVVKADGQAKVNLHAVGLQLRQAMLLTGRELPVDATINFDANGEGPLTNIGFTGSFKAVNLPSHLIANVGMTMNADCKIEGNYMASSLTGTAQITGTEFAGILDLEKIIDPITSPLQFQPITSEPPFSDWTLQMETSSGSVPASGGVTLKPALKIDGTLGKPKVSGTVDFENLLASTGTTSLTLKSGSLTFLPASPENPLLQASGTGQAKGRPYVASINGNWAHPELRFSLPDGTTIPDFKAFMNGQDPVPTATPSVNLAPATSPAAMPLALPSPSPSPAASASPSATPAP